MTWNKPLERYCCRKHRGECVASRWSLACGGFPVFWDILKPSLTCLRKVWREVQRAQGRIVTLSHLLLFPREPQILVSPWLGLQLASGLALDGPRTPKLRRCTIIHLIHGFLKWFLFTKYVDTMCNQMNTTREKHVRFFSDESRCIIQLCYYHYYFTVLKLMI